MGKKRVQSRQVRQVRQVRPKSVPVPAGGGDQRKQRERYIQSGGLLQGYAPETVIRIGRISAGTAAACVLVGVALLFLVPYGWPVRVAAAVVWILPIVLGATFLFQGIRLARKDLKQEPKVVQGQLMGASEASTSIGLGMLMLKTRGGVEQFLVAPAQLARVPGNQVNVMLSVTPGLRHVRSVAVMGQRMMARPEQPVPAVLTRLRVLPIVTPAALAASAIVGDDVVALLPIPGGDLVHAIASLAAGLVLAAIVFGASHLFQRQLMREVQSLMPGGLR